MTEWAAVAQFKALQARVEKEENRRAAGDTSVANLVVAEEGRRAAFEAEVKVRLAAIEAKLPKAEPPKGEEPKPVNPDLFWGRKISDFTERIMAAPDRVTEVKDPLGSGETVFKYTVQDSDVAPLTPTENPRAQMGTPYFIKNGQEFWFRTKLLVPNDFPTFNGWLTFYSVYGPPYAGSSPWHLSTWDGKNIVWEEHEKSFSHPIERGKWMDFTQHGLFSENGWLEIYLNGELVMPKTNAALRNRTNNGGNNNVRISSYRQKGLFQTCTHYWGPLLCGSTKASVGL